MSTVGFVSLLGALSFALAIGLLVVFYRTKSQLADNLSGCEQLAGSVPFLAFVAWLFWLALNL